MASEQSYRINLNAISFRSWYKLQQVDEQMLTSGDPKDYLGIAYFWGQEYKHGLRDASPAQRVRIYRAWRELDLDLIGNSPAHAAIVTRVLGPGWV